MDKTLTGTSNDYARAVQETTDGGFIIAGYSYSGISDDKSETSRGGMDYWLVKFGLSGELNFAFTNYDVSEANAYCDLYVTRTGGSVSNVNVNYATVDGSVLAGTDYVATNGVLLIWSDGETNAKLVRVGIINRYGAAGARNFRVVLSNAVVAVLGARSNAMVNIRKG